MTLKDIIDLRKAKYKERSHWINTSTDFWKGYATGWEAAYQDLEEILKQNGFDMDVAVLKRNK